MAIVTKDERIKGFKNLWKYLKYFKKYKWLCLGFWSMLIACGVIGFFIPVILGNIISEIASANFDSALNYAWILFGLELINLFFSVLQTPFFKMLENKVKLDVKIDIVSSSFNINIGQYEKLGNGVFITRLTSDLNSLSNSFKSISETIVSFMSKIGFLIYISVINIWLGIFLLLFIIVRYYVYQVRIHYFSILKPIVHKKSETVNSTVGETIRGIKDIKTLDMQQSLLTQIETQQTEFMQADNKEWYVGVALCAFANFVSIVCNLLFVMLCITLMQRGFIAIAVFYTAYVYKSHVMDFAVHLGNLQNYLKEIEVSAWRVFDLKDGIKYQFNKYGPEDLPEYRGNIEFQNVSFGYTPHTKVLNNVSFKIKRNTHVAFVGESGCGKSTIVSLICKLYTPTDGNIKYDNKNDELLSEKFFKQITMINQFPYLFNMTIRDNMKLVKPDATDEEIYEALSLSNAFEFVWALPNRLDSYLGEGGTRLSGGQKQRICIARALLKDAKVIIFDEATSSLDNL
ncbi:MAG: ABC transporter ATP-binding protein, partial [Clostridia bacterium]|nr:ABC transporter ATP-binding protein [Clostridia bacterium]